MGAEADALRGRGGQLAEFGRIALGVGWSLGAVGRHAGLHLRRALRAALPFRGPRYRRLLFAPPDLRTADPTVAADIYSGQFIFAGQLVSTEGRSPFEVDPPSLEWAHDLFGFGWLRHLHAAGSALARDNARSLVEQFLDEDHDRDPFAQPPKVVARRIMSMLAHSPLVLEGADHDFYHGYLAALRADIRRLQDGLRLTEDPALRLSGLCALTAAGLCIEGADRLALRSGQRLAEALNEQIHGDGGHVSRNPRVLVELMLELLPLRATHAARGIETPGGVVAAMDRILPHIRMLRHGDGSLALFNGMGATEVDALATIFASHDMAGGFAMEAPITGYTRLEGGASLLLLDAGAPPPFEASAAAAAGAASFEFSHGLQRIFVNCGVPRRWPAGPPLEVRATAAQNATVVSDTSSARFIRRGDEVRQFAGPTSVTLQRSSERDRASLRVAHDGYARRFGVVVERDLSLSADGGELTGEERLVALKERAPPPAVTRFHLHPEIRLEAADGVLRLLTPRGGTWGFRAGGARAEIEESAFFAGPDGPRRTLQIVLTPEDGAAKWSWRLTRL